MPWTMVFGFGRAGPYEEGPYEVGARDDAGPPDDVLGVPHAFMGKGAGPLVASKAALVDV